MKSNRMLTAGYLCLLFLLTPGSDPVEAANEPSLFPWKTGESFTYRPADGNAEFFEQATLSKMRKKRNFTEHQFDFSIVFERFSVRGTYHLDETGRFHGCSGILQMSGTTDYMQRFSVTHRAEKIRITMSMSDDSGEGRRVTRDFDDIPSDAWVLMDGALFLALHLALEPFGPEYESVQPFIVLNFFNKHRRAGNMRLKVTGREILNVHDQQLDAYTVMMEIPKQAFSMNPADQDAVARVHLWIAESGHTLLKVLSDDLRLDTILVP